MEVIINLSAPGIEPKHGDLIRIEYPDGTWEEREHWVIIEDPENNLILKEGEERQWRDLELERTDKFVVLPDYPYDVLTYREELRAYPEQEDFPNGERPVLQLLIE